jgi:hypothetical protein
MAYPFYNNPYAQPYQAYQPQMQQPAYQGGIIWVNDVNEASAYPIAPNTVVPLWDRNSQTVYWKQSDAAGRQGIRILDYKERSATQEEQKPTPELATKEDVAGLAAAIHALQEMIKGGTENA